MNWNDLHTVVCLLFQGTGTVQVTSLPNGTGPSPPPPGGTVKGYPLNFVIKGNSTTQGGSTSVAGVTASVATPTNLSKGQNLVFNNMGISQLQHQSQLIVQQPPSPMSQNVHQRGMLVMVIKLQTYILRHTLNVIFQLFFFTVIL